MNQIEEMIQRAEDLLEEQLDYDHDKVVKWRTDCRTLIKTLYGKGSKEDKGMRAADISSKLIILRSINESRNKSEANNVVYNVHGSNARINVHSVDNSTNIVNTTSQHLFDELRNVLQNNIADSTQRTVIIDAVNNLEESQNTPRFMDAYQRFISLAVDHMQLITPFIPVLTQMLS
ncbi:hypothetical protein [Peribacillus loiseleuriae]|uniref:Uncharacterized protein n=1 Tax=Peribacillus loiseleuriae TaxID=1679170 RepID=A0A0K9GV84_9BACI|nr:hypothetical protein [Peribacillus loiseleuriae]KMY50536.1 hypothetical protein AC625_14335 [Peribacillus loiseleuriae]